MISLNSDQGQLVPLTYHSLHTAQNPRVSWLCSRLCYALGLIRRQKSAGRAVPSLHTIAAGAAAVARAHRADLISGDHVCTAMPHHHRVLRQLGHKYAGGLSFQPHAQAGKRPVPCCHDCP